MTPEDEMPKEDREALIAAKALKELTTSKGWEIVKAIIQKQVEVRTNKIIFTPRGSQTSEYEYEFIKGEASGMKTIVGIVEAEYETLAAVNGVKKDV